MCGGPVSSVGRVLSSNSGLAANFSPPGDKGTRMSLIFPALTTQFNSSPVPVTSLNSKAVYWKAEMAGK
ncbi:hypothetical protein DPMN_114110 [Dreissena polymorpha]|uniref:Uncharacterized protein n=1 Tax=Dreissena polymorpha TaxID=45954 RepID=A0A9D4KK91_DREPO|nr:hypothetical protein DPMN_114110 [Dreissena polymorpha]